MLRLAILAACIVDISTRTILDLTHTLDENAPKYPNKDFGVHNLTYYGLHTLSEKWYPSGMWLSLKKVEFFEHIGTHMDAPFHFGHGRQTMEEIPPQKLIGPGVVINVKDKVVDNPKYSITIDDIKEYEEKYGQIPPDAIVMMNSGWSDKYDKPELVFGTDTLEDISSFRFPGFDIETCKFLLTERRIAVLGTDAPSPDPGHLPDWYCHRYLQPNNVPILEYVAYLDTMPPAGATVFLGSMKHRGGSGGQVRILAVIDDDEKVQSGSRGSGMCITLQLVMTLFLLLLGVAFRF